MARKSLKDPDSVPLKLSEDDSLRLILLYQNEPCLYDVSSVGYRNREVRAAAMERIAISLSVDGFGPKEIGVKLKNLRSCYSKELRKIESSAKSGTRFDQLYVPKVFWFPLLNSFLLPHVQTGPPKNNNDDSERNNVIQIDDESTDEERTDDDLEEETTTTTSTLYQNGMNRDSRSSSGEPDPKYFKSNQELTSTLVPPMYLRTLERARNVRDFSEPGRETEFDLWARSIATQLNGMEVRRALNLQLQIQTLLSNERLSYEESKPTHEPTVAAYYTHYPGLNSGQRRRQVRHEGQNEILPGRTSAAYGPPANWEQPNPFQHMNGEM